jgi:hypothetical protein
MAVDLYIQYEDFLEHMVGRMDNKVRLDVEFSRVTRAEPMGVCTHLRFQDDKPATQLQPI